MIDNNKLRNKFIFYATIGLLFGTMFPIFSYFYCYLYLIPEDQNLTLFQLHKSFPVLYIIDTVPFVLSGFSSILWREFNQLKIKYQYKIQTRNQSLEKANVELTKLNSEKETLLKEIHHRVKNNLQIITSLLSLQSGFIQDTETKMLFRYSQYRINSLAMIHDSLYQSDNITQIDIGLYTKKILDGLLVAMKGNNNNIQLRISIENVNLNIDTAIPLGLLINEIITNALKYGIKGDDHGVYSHRN